MAKHAPTVERLESNTYLIIAHDGQDSQVARDSHLDGHLEHIEKNWPQYLACGPVNEAGQKTLKASFFLLSAESEQAARDLLAGDPYITSGMYERIELHHVTVAAGALLGGVIWESADAIRAKASTVG